MGCIGIFENDALRSALSANLFTGEKVQIYLSDTKTWLEHKGRFEECNSGPPLAKGTLALYTDSEHPPSKQSLKKWLLVFNLLEAIRKTG